MMNQEVKHKEEKCKEVELSQRKNIIGRCVRSKVIRKMLNGGLFILYISHLYLLYLFYFVWINMK